MTTVPTLPIHQYPPQTPIRTMLTQSYPHPNNHAPSIPKVQHIESKQVSPIVNASLGNSIEGYSVDGYRDSRGQYNRNVPSEMRVPSDQIRRVIVRRNSPPVIFHYNQLMQLQKQDQGQVQQNKPQVQANNHSQNLSFSSQNLSVSQQNNGNTNSITQNQYQQLLDQFNSLSQKFTSLSQQNSQLLQHYTIVTKQYTTINNNYHVFVTQYHTTTKELAFLLQEFQAIVNEEQWMEAQEKFEMIVERMKESSLELEQQLSKEGLPTNEQQNEKMWQHRYNDLLEQYQLLNQNYVDLQTSLGSNQSQRFSSLNQRFSHLQSEHNQLLNQYQHLHAQFELKHSQLQEAHSHLQQAQSHIEQTQNQLQKDPRIEQNSILRSQNEEMLQYTQKLQNYVEELEAQNMRLAEQARSDDKWKNKEEQVQQLTQMLYQYQAKIKKMENEASIKKPENESPSFPIQQFHNLKKQNQQLKLSLKESEHAIQKHVLMNNNLTDKIRYLNQEIYTNSVLLQSSNADQKLIRISTETNSGKTQNDGKNNASINLIRQFQQKLQDSDRLLASARKQTTQWQQKCYNLQSELRKLQHTLTETIRSYDSRHQDNEAEHRRHLIDKDASIRSLELRITEIDQEVRRKLTDKDNIIKNLELNLLRVRQQIEISNVQKELTIKTLRENIGRMELEIKQRNVELSQIRIGKAAEKRTPSQSFVVYDPQRFQDQVRLLSQQLDRRNQEINKLKRDKQIKIKEYKQLETDYDGLSKELIKRRSQISSLKRANEQLERVSFELDTLKATITKKNSEISQLKMIGFEKDKLKMELNIKNKQIQRIGQNLKWRQKQNSGLIDRNLQLEGKLRTLQSKPSLLVQEFNNIKFTSTVSPSNDSVAHLNQSLKKKDNEISKMKIQLQDALDKISSLTEEANSIKVKHTQKIKTLDIQIIDLKGKLSIEEKKISETQGFNHQLTEQIRKMKQNMETNHGSEISRLKEHYISIQSRSEEEFKLSLSKLRNYQTQLNEYEVEFQSLRNKLKQSEVLKQEFGRKIKILTERLEEKQGELRDVKSKGDVEGSEKRRKESRLIQVQAQLKAKEMQILELRTKIQEHKTNNKKLKREFEEYRSQIAQRLSPSPNQELQTLSRIIQDQAKYVSNDLHFKVRDRQANQVFEEKIIYGLKQEIDMLRAQLQGRGTNFIKKEQRKQLKEEQMSKKQIYSNSVLLVEQANFYKQKTKQLQERVNNHIKVNRQLKDKLDQLMIMQEGNNQGLASEQLRQMGEKIQFLEDRILKMNEQEKARRKELRQSADIRSALQEEILNYQHQMTRMQSQISLYSSEIQRLHETKQPPTGNRSQSLVYQFQLLRNQIIQIESLLIEILEGRDVRSALENSFGKALNCISRIQTALTNEQ